ncbi:hypothetical protein EVAR_9619_1 [Eumeta japonica]|uniref:Uncharacterized protein n=1 Tax=Eumeta variegata TaxID=151549 RepID=A0A4C1TKY6_EUMVA|nr:hypothetical protein EVAR_9619_1 [Eumeta japonica]
MQRYANLVQRVSQPRLRAIGKSISAASCRNKIRDRRIKAAVIFTAAAWECEANSGGGSRRLRRVVSPQSLSSEYTQSISIYIQNVSPRLLCFRRLLLRESRAERGCAE